MSRGGSRNLMSLMIRVPLRLPALRLACNCRCGAAEIRRCRNFEMQKCKNFASRARIRGTARRSKRATFIKRDKLLLALSCCSLMLKRLLAFSRAMTKPREVDRPFAPKAAMSQHSGSFYVTEKHNGPFSAARDDVARSSPNAGHRSLMLGIRSGMVLAACDRLGMRPQIRCACVTNANVTIEFPYIPYIFRRKIRH